MGMDDWPEWEKAGETEFDTIESNDTWVLVDENEAINQGAYIYDTRFVFTRKRDGKYKARQVLRGDQQVWDDWTSPDDDDDADESIPSEFYSEDIERERVDDEEEK